MLCIVPRNLHDTYLANCTYQESQPLNFVLHRTVACTLARPQLRFPSLTIFNPPLYARPNQ